MAQRLLKWRCQSVLSSSVVHSVYSLVTHNRLVDVFLNMLREASFRFVTTQFNCVEWVKFQNSALIHGLKLICKTCFQGLLKTRNSSPEGNKIYWPAPLSEDSDWTHSRRLGQVVLSSSEIQNTFLSTCTRGAFNGYKTSNPSKMVYYTLESCEVIIWNKMSFLAAIVR